ncbi:MAG: hypothetical protein JO020_04885 [Chloroflexi bacterium]|nr:hypothetical protein [Chloroflexota bacterium]
MTAAPSVGNPIATWLSTRLPTKATPLVVALLTTGLYAAYVFWRLRLMGYDSSFFVVAGPDLTDPALTLPNLHVWPPGVTYDGQFYYRLALEPWTAARTAYGITLDLPAYRQQRVLYPVLVWLLSAGSWRLVPTALIVANLLAVSVLSYCAALFTAAFGRNAFASVLVTLYPGYVVTISRDLAELTEAAALLLGIVLLQRRRYAAAAGALLVSMLAKETMLLVPLVGCAVWATRWLRRRQTSARELLVWLTPLFGYAVWCLLLWVRWDSSPIGQGSVNFGPPFVALSEHLKTLGLGTSAWRASALEIALLVLLTAMVLLVIAIYQLDILDSVLAVACVAYALLALWYAPYVWSDDHSYLRALHEIAFAGALALIARSVWTTRVLGFAAGGLWLAFAFQSGPAP